MLYLPRAPCLRRSALNEGEPIWVGESSTVIIPWEMPSAEPPLCRPPGSRRPFLPLFLGRFTRLGEDHREPSTRTVTARTTSVPSTSLAFRATSPERNRTWVAQAEELARTRSTAPSIRNGTHSAASRSPTTSAHRRPSFPRDIPALRGRSRSSCSRIAPTGSGRSVLSPERRRERLRRSGWLDTTLLHAPDLRARRDLRPVRDGQHHLSPSVQPLGEAAPAVRVQR